MSTHYKLCWHEKIVYKFKLEWPPDCSNMLHHEQDIIGSIVQMAREGKTPSSLFIEEFAVNIQLSKWKMSGQMVFEKDGVMYEPYHQQFSLLIQEKHLDLPPPALTAPSVSQRSTESSSPTPKEKEPPLREARRKIGLPANIRQKKLSETRAVVCDQSRRDLVRTVSYGALNSPRRVRSSYPRRKLTMRRYYIPDTIYRLLHQTVNASEQGQDGTIIILGDNTILRDGMGPRAIEFSHSPTPASTAVNRVLHTLRRL